MSEDSKLPIFERFIRLTKDAAIPSYGEVVAFIASTNSPSLIAAVDKAIEVGLPAEAAALYVAAAEEIRRHHQLIPKPRVSSERERERAKDRRDECDLETWAVLSAAVLRRDRHTCVYCATTEGPFEADHIVPLCAGGRSSMRNLACACRPCNSAKGGRTPEEWRGAR